MKILYVCSANAIRSRTAEDFLDSHFTQHEILSAGTNAKQCMQAGTVLLTEELLIWADLVFAMEIVHQDRIKAAYPEYSNKIKVLGIPDVYKYGQSNLIEKLIWRSEQYLET